MAMALGMCCGMFLLTIQSSHPDPGLPNVDRQPWKRCSTQQTNDYEVPSFCGRHGARRVHEEGTHQGAGRMVSQVW